MSLVHGAFSPHRCHLRRHRAAARFALESNALGVFSVAETVLHDSAAKTDPCMDRDSHVA